MNKIIAAIISPTAQTWKMITTIILVSVTALLAVWDGITDIFGTSASTESHIIYLAAKAYPIIAFAAGILCGHLFWVQHIDPNETLKKEIERAGKVHPVDGDGI